MNPASHIFLFIIREKNDLEDKECFLFYPDFGEWWGGGGFSFIWRTQTLVHCIFNLVVWKSCFQHVSQLACPARCIFPSVGSLPYADQLCTYLGRSVHIGTLVFNSPTFVKLIVPPQVNLISHSVHMRTSGPPPEKIWTMARGKNGYFPPPFVRAPLIRIIGQKIVIYMLVLKLGRPKFATYLPCSTLYLKYNGLLPYLFGLEIDS